MCFQIPSIHTCAADDIILQVAQPSTSWFWDVLVGYHLIQLLLFVGRFIPSLNFYTGAFVSSQAYPAASFLDVSHKVFNVDCLFPQYTTEWSVPLSEATATLYELKGWLDREHADPKGLRPHFPIEIRVSQKDDIWLSPAYGQATVWIGIVQYKYVS